MRQTLVVPGGDAFSKWKGMVIGGNFGLESSIGLYSTELNSVRSKLNN